MGAKNHMERNLWLIYHQEHQTISVGAPIILSFSQWIGMEGKMVCMKSQSHRRVTTDKSDFVN